MTGIGPNRPQSSAGTSSATLDGRRRGIDHRIVVDGGEPRAGVPCLDQRCFATGWGVQTRPIACHRARAACEQCGSRFRGNVNRSSRSTDDVEASITGSSSTAASPERAFLAWTSDASRSDGASRPARSRVVEFAPLVNSAARVSAGTSIDRAARRTTSRHRTPDRRATAASPERAFLAWTSDASRPDGVSLIPPDRVSSSSRRL